MSVLNGSLETFALPDVFRLLAHSAATGALSVVRESGDGMVYFRGGEVYYSYSSLTREFLGQRLVNAKLITQGQLLRALDEQKKLGEVRLGDLLVEKGYLSKELLNTFLKEQIQDSIFHLLQWDRGSFSFDSDVVSPQEIGLSVSVENLVMESSRRIDEWEVIQRKIPNMDVVIRLAPTPPDDMEINIKPEEWKIMVLADGKRTVRDIAAAGEKSEFDTSKVLYGLVTAGLLDVSTSPSSGSQQTQMPSVASKTAAPPASAPVAAAMPPAEPPLPVEEVAESEPVPEPALESEPVPEPALESEPVPEPALESEPREEPSFEIEAVEPPVETPEVEVVAQEQGALKREPVPVASNGASVAGDGESHGDQGVTKDMLLRLIEGVRNL